MSRGIYDADAYIAAVKMNEEIKEWIKNDDRITSVNTMEQIMEEEKPEWFEHMLDHPKSRRIICRYVFGKQRHKLADMRRQAERENKRKQVGSKE